jgi:hypothetical protein
MSNRGKPPVPKSNEVMQLAKRNEKNYVADNKDKAI